MLVVVAGFLSLLLLLVCAIVAILVCVGLCGVVLGCCFVVMTMLWQLLLYQKLIESIDPHPLIVGVHRYRTLFLL